MLLIDKLNNLPLHLKRTSEWKTLLDFIRDKDLKTTVQLKAFVKAEILDGERKLVALSSSSTNNRIRTVVGKRLVFFRSIQEKILGRL